MTASADMERSGLDRLPEPSSAHHLIHDAVSRIAHLADEGDVDGYIAMFTEDAIWHSPANPGTGTNDEFRKGRAEIAAGAQARLKRGIQGPGSATRHVVTTIEVRPQDDETAIAVSYWMFFRSTTGKPELTSMGRYDDLFRRTGSGWLLARRDITLG